MFARKLILKSMLSPGDIVMLTACVRDLHAAYPGEYLTDVRTPCAEIWKTNPYITPLADHEAETIDMHYDSPVPIRYQQGHFVNGYRRFLEYRLGRKISQGPLRGDIHLTPEELALPSQAMSRYYSGPFWIVVAGGKNDFTCKLWERDRYQKVVDHFYGRIQFVQVGERGHDHRPLRNVINLLGKTNLRQFILLMHHASGVLCPVTAAMHLAQAVPCSRSVLREPRPCVVIAGAREPWQWEKYDGHSFMHNCGQLSCARRLDVPGACWRSRVVRRGDGSPQDDPDRICEQPVCSRSGQIVPRCMDMISVEAVIAEIERFLH